MTRERAIRLAEKWASGGVCTLTEGEAEEYHKVCLEALMNQPQWISVKDKLPKSDTPVLVYCKDGTVREDAYSDMLGWSLPFCWMVTHWRPLPEPPKTA